jgi:uridine phosphorylase
MNINNNSMSERIIPESELILNPDGSLYHIKLKAEHIADDVIVVGDQHRVERISKHFDSIEHKSISREFVTHTGIYKGKKITVLSTGIGTDNIDIVVNELDAAINIDLTTRKIKKEHRKLNIIRIGTSGALQEDLPVDSYLISRYGLGFDGLLQYYKLENTEEEKELLNDFMSHTAWNSDLATPYFVRSSDELFNKINRGDMTEGITGTAAGFYGPQGRVLRLPLRNNELNEQLTSFKSKGQRVTNFEMETSALYGLGRLLGHNCVTVCVLIANRLKGEYSDDYKKPVDALIKTVLDRLVD